MEPGIEYVEVELGGVLLFFPAGDFRLMLNKLFDGSVDMTVTGTVNFGQILVPTVGASFRLGDDFGSTVVRLRGTLQFP